MIYFLFCPDKANMRLPNTRYFGIIIKIRLFNPDQLSETDLATYNITKKIVEVKMKKFTLFLLIFIFIVLIAGALLIYGWTRDINPDAAETAAFSATIEDEGGVDLSSAFRLCFDSPVSSAAVNKALTVAPEVDFGVHQGTSRKEVLITPGAPLTEDTIYTFTLAVDDKTYSWAVQTKGTWAVKEVRPLDRQTVVPLDASVDIVMSQGLTVNTDSLDECFSISPAVEGEFTQQGRLLRFQPKNNWQPGTVYTVTLAPGLCCQNSSQTLEEGRSWSFETSAEQQLWSCSAAATFITKEIPSFTLRGLNAESGQKRITVVASLYGFADIVDYQEALEKQRDNCPSWSNSFRYYNQTDVEPLQLISSKALPLEPAEDNSLLLRLEQPLAPGCYMLRVKYGAEYRDCLFMVSGLEAYLLTDADQALLWCFDASGAPVAATVAELWGGDRSVANADGLAQLATGSSGLFEISYEDQKLLLPLWNNIQELAYPNVWRYLYCDKSVYANGDSLYYYGLLTTRDGSKLDYDRVSVYIVPQSSGLDAAAYRDYAQLNGGIFSGSLALPQLQAGEYSLQIWQSGLLYIQQSFLVNDDPGYVRPAAEVSGSEKDKVFLHLGDSYNVPGLERKRLYVQASGGILDAQVQEGSDYQLSFNPNNLLDSYLLVMDHSASGFTLGQYTSLYRAADSNELLLESSGLSGLSCGKSHTIQFKVRNQDGQTLPELLLAVQLYSSRQTPQLNPLQEIYQDYQGSGLSPYKPTESTGGYCSGKTIAFGLIKTDENGQASWELELPADCPEDCYLLAQAISSSADGLSVGSLLNPLSVSGQNNIEDEDLSWENGYDYEISPLNDGITLDSASRLVICASQKRIELLNMLLSPAFSHGEMSSAELLFAQAYARQLLVDYGGDSFSVLFDRLMAPAAYQKADGGLGEAEAVSDLTTSAKVAAMTPSGVSYYALGRYFKQQLGRGLSLTEQAIALAGLASCKQPVLIEIKSLLNQNVDDYTFCWLLWGLLRSGDRTTAEQLYATRSFVDSGKAQQQAWRAVLAAALDYNNEARELLYQAGADDYNWPMEQVLVARALLPRTEQEELGLSYNVGEDDYEAEAYGVNDYFISPLAFSDNVHFNQADSGLFYCNIFWLGSNDEVKQDGGEAL